MDVQGWPFHEALTYTRPVLLLKGASSKFVKAKHFNRIASSFPMYTLQSIKGAGHWVHSEQPGATSRALAHFLNKVEEYRENLNDT